MKALSICLFYLICALPAAAERVVSAAEFEAMVSGQTVYFERHGQSYGSEQYFPDKRVIWAFEGGQCNRGIWFENTAGEICFVYESNPVPQCWHFLEMPSGGFQARAIGAPPSDDLVRSGQDDVPIDCPLPDLGV